MQTFTQLAGPIATIIASLTAGGIAVWLGRSQVASARLQAETANDKLVLDLFDRRLKIYSQAREVVAAAMRNGTTNMDQQFEFLRAVDGAKFLFGPEVTEYLDGLYKNLVALQYANDELAHGSDRTAAGKRRAEKFDKVQDFYNQAPKLMAPYLEAHHKFGLN